jgi:hypothetical protein
MKLSVPIRLALCLLALAGIVLPEVAAAQCYGQCVVVAPPFCRRCMEAEQPTGVLCRDSGACGCFYVQCAAANLEAEQPPTQTVLAELGLGAPVFASAACLSASAAKPASSR